MYPFLLVVCSWVSTAPTLKDRFRNFIDNIFTRLFVNTCEDFLYLFIFQGRFFMFFENFLVYPYNTTSYVIDFKLLFFLK